MSEQADREICTCVIGVHMRGTPSTSSIEDCPVHKGITQRPEPAADLRGFDEWWTHNSARPAAQEAKHMFKECWAAALAEERAKAGPHCHKCDALVEDGDVFCDKHEAEIIESIVRDRVKAALVDEREPLRKALQHLVDELNWYAGKHGLGPQRVMAALTKAELVLKRSQKG